MSNGPAWWYSDRGESIGPLVLDELKVVLSRRSNASETFVWSDGFSDWQRAGDVSALNGARVNAIPVRAKPNRDPRDAEKKSAASLFDDADQDRVRADLSAFFGPRAETYLHTYEKMRARTGRRRMSAYTWSWPVFLGSFTWFFYRKMYILGAILIFAPVILSYLIGSVGGGIPIVFALLAKSMYVHQGLSRILKADGLRLTGLERSDYLQRAGGVSLTAGVFAGFIFLAIVALATYAALARHRVGL
jgi:GYF domain 2/Protein of unknown function (DUF2628)